MAQPIEFFVAEDKNIRGPLKLEQIRREFESGTERDVLFRMEGCKRFLPGAAWDPLSDLFPPASPPDRPDVVTEKPPRDLANLDPAARDKLLWFVEDADGVMGPVTGAFVARGLMTGRIPITAAVSLVSVPGWIRGTSLFPAALEGATEIRMRPMGTFSCPYCLEPVIVGSSNCLMCNENVALGEPGLSLRQAALLVVGALAFVIVPLVVGALSARSTARVHTPEQVVDPAKPTAPPETSAAPVTSADAPAASSSAATPSDPPAPAASEGPALQGKVLAKIDLAVDADDAIVLPQGHVAVARKSALDIVDPKNGLVVTSAKDVSAARKLERLSGALYAIGANRIAAIDAGSLRLSRLIDLRTPVLPGAAASDLAIFPSVIDRSVVVVAAPYHVEIARFRFANDVAGLVAVDPQGAWAAAAVGDPRTRLDAIASFAPRVSPSAQIIRRTAMNDAVVALSVRGADAFVTLSANRIVTVKLDAPGVPAPPSVTGETCVQPVFVRAAPSMVVVGCREGKALALHVPSTLVQDTRIELGGEVVAMEVSPSGGQVLVATGAPAPGLFVVDLPSGSTRRVAVTEEVSSVAFGADGSRATAFSARSHRVWVLE